MTQYLIIPLIKKDHDVRIDEVVFTPENYYVLLTSVYQDCLVVDLSLAIALSHTSISVAALAEKRVISLSKCRAQHQHAAESIQLQDMGQAGLGAFLSPANSLIPEEDALVYSGLYLPYGILSSAHGDKGFQIQQEDQRVLIAGDGQLSGYIQHLPENHTIPDDLMKLSAASANLIKEFCFLFIDQSAVVGLPCSLCFPIRRLVPVKPLDANNLPLLLGFDYSVSYWYAREQAPLFFNQYGEVLAEQPFLFSLSQAKKTFILAYATEQAVRQVCQQKYFQAAQEIFYFDDIKKFDSIKRFVSIDCV